MKRPVIVLFVHNRPAHTRRLLDSLAAQSLRNFPVCVFMDGDPKDESVSQVRSLIHSRLPLPGFGKAVLIEHQTKLGLATSILGGISHAFGKSESVIVFEDDLVLSRNCLAFLDAALSFYRDDPLVFSISGYGFPFNVSTSVYPCWRSSSWGWATWRDRWERVDWNVSDYEQFARNKDARARFNRGGGDLSYLLDRQMAGEIDSWCIRFLYSQWKHGAFCICPRVSKVQNTGFDGSGRHCGRTHRFHVTLDAGAEVTESFQHFDSVPRTVESELRRLFRSLPA